VFGLILL